MGAPTTPSFADGGVSFWYRRMGTPKPRPALPGSGDYDVCVVGGGFTGLWTAYYLKKARPTLRVAVLEKEFAGFGASGRNGGWLSAELAGSPERYARSGGREGAVALQRAMIEGVDEVLGVCAAEGIEADIVKGGVLYAAVNPAQRERLRAEVAHARRWGLGEEDLRLLDADDRGATPPRTVAALHAMIGRLFPAAATARVDHAWSGVLGVPRDWCATVILDRVTGLGLAGGYLGSGVTTANVAGRTLRDLLLGEDTPLTRLPWVGRRARRWEPEPLRWLGVRLVYALYHAADRRENAGLPRTSVLATAAALLSGRP